MKEENIEVVTTLVEEEALIDRTGDHIVLKDLKEEIIAQDSEMKGKTTGQEQGESTLLKKAGDTLATDEGDAKRPLVMEGLLQASQ